MPLERTRVVNAPVAVHTEAQSVDALMSREQFALHKLEIMRILRTRGDAAPRVMTTHVPMDAPGEGYIPRLRAELAKHPGGKLVRGAKLLYISLPPSVWKGIDSWKGIFHCAIERADGHYVDPNPPLCPEHVGQAYIFVPSSTFHSKLTDAQILSDEWLFGNVVGGNRAFAEAVVIEQSVMGRRNSMIARSPSELRAKRNVHVRLLPHFEEWLAARGHGGRAQYLGELLGFPSYDCTEAIDEDNLESMLERSLHNEESLLEGFPSLELEMDVTNRLMQGTMTTDAAKRVFYKHYDQRFAEMQQVADARLGTRFREAGFRTGAVA